MENRWVVMTARLLWIVPLFLCALAINQALVAFDIRHTLNSGEQAIADVIEIKINDRVDIPFGYVSLKVELDNAREIVKEKMALPYTLLPQVKDRVQLDVLVDPGSRQEIVIANIASTQWKMAGMQSMMCFFGFLFSGIGVFFWNRLLNTRGDPAEAAGH